MPARLNILQIVYYNPYISINQKIMLPTGEAIQSDPVKPEGVERLEEFMGLLNQIEEKANTVVSENEGRVDGESVKFAKGGFRETVLEIGWVAKKANTMLDESSYSSGLNPFRANGGPEKITLGRMALIEGDEEFNRVYLEEDTTNLRAFLQKFFDSAREIVADFKTADRIDNGEISNEYNCTDEDFEIALSLVKVYQDHSVFMFKELPKQATVSASPRGHHL